MAAARGSSRETHRSKQHDTLKARAQARARAGVRAREQAAASEVQGGSCVQVSPASTLLLHDNSPVAFTTLIIADIRSAAIRHSER
jgi:hypothetical protein